MGPREGGALATRRGRVEILLFRAQGEWLAQALALAGFEPEPGQPRAATLRAGTEPARRAAQGLRELASSASGSRQDPLARACRALELLAIGLSAQPEPLAPAARRPSPRGVALDAALERLGEGPLEHLSLSRFAAALGFSERQASRLVRERLGCSFGAHVAALRLARAQLPAGGERPAGDRGGGGGRLRIAGAFQPAISREHRQDSERVPGSDPRSARASPRHPDSGAGACRGAGGEPASEEGAEARSSAFTRLSSQAEKGMLPS